MSEHLGRINREEVTPELLGEVLALYARMEPEDRRVFEARMFRLFELLRERRLGGAESDLAIAIEFRLEALAALQGDHALSAWTLPGRQGGDGADYVHADLVKAAAEEPLIETGTGRPRFDLASFRERVLASAGPRGNA